jgi:transposase
MARQQPIVLTDEQRHTVHTFLHRGQAKARILTRARILLSSADGQSIQAIAQALGVCPATVSNVRQHFLHGGLDAVLHDRVQQRRRSALSGVQAAHLIAIACSPAPDGYDHWTIRLLADKAVELGYVTAIAHDTIHRLLKKTTSSPGASSTGASRA